MTSHVLGNRGVREAPEMGGTSAGDPDRRGSADRSICVLLVEDDLALQRMILDYFAQNDIRTLIAAGRKEMASQLEANQVDLVVLDLRLGHEDGLDLLREVRSNSDVPIIITTGHRRDEIDRVVGLELGADDYITKPFNLRELLARVRAVLRRSGPAVSLPDPDRSSYRFLGWRLNRRARRLTDPSGAPVTLTKGEYALLVAFVDAPNRPLSREQLLQATRMHADVFDRSIDVQILRLRRKLESDPSAPKIIKTERGVGYVFAAQVERV
jgi:DNA-binding response OmpR family regulator